MSKEPLFGTVAAGDTVALRNHAGVHRVTVASTTPILIFLSCTSYYRFDGCQVGGNSESPTLEPWNESTHPVEIERKRIADKVYSDRHRISNEAYKVSADQVNRIIAILDEARS